MNQTSHQDTGRRAVVVVSRFNEAVTRKLLKGARDTLEASGFGVDVHWVPGAFELPVTVLTALETGRYELAVALGAVVRGETPHFDYVSAEAARGLQQVSLETGLAVGFGVLTCDTMAQALARAGGDAGNKGVDAAGSAIETAALLRTIAGDVAD